MILQNGVDFWSPSASHQIRHHSPHLYSPS